MSDKSAAPPPEARHKHRNAGSSGGPGSDRLPPVCTYADIAAYFGVSERTLFREVKRGALRPHYRSRRLTRFDRHEVLRWWHDEFSNSRPEQVGNS